MVLTLLIQIALILLASRIVGWLFTKIGQPQVVGEMVAGIMLGPSLLGLFAPELSSAVFPAASIPNLNVLSQVGVTLFLFLIGLELDPGLLRRRGHAAVVISHVSIIAPFLLGAVLALFLYPRLFNATSAMSFTSVALFLGAALSITAFPVLARILTERNLHRTKVGAIAITCAAVDDVTAWCMLAFVVAVARSEGLSSALATAGLAGLYVTLMFRFVRPFLARLQDLHEQRGSLSHGALAIVLVLVVLSAATTEAIGIHALFGAFLLGALMPKGQAFVRHLAGKLEDFVVVFLLPLFFAYTGLQTRIGLLDSPELWAITALVVVVACAGKLGGSALAARACGFSWRESGAIGVLMNTRGLMELVILNIGRELGVITDAVFAMMVIMALVTTAATTPLLAWIYPKRLQAAGLAARRGSSAYSILIPTARGAHAGPLLELARRLAGGPGDEAALVALHVTRPAEHEAYRAALASLAEPRAGESAPVGGSSHTPAGGSSRAPALAPLLDAARARGIALESLDVVGSEVADAVNAVAGSRKTDLVLLRYGAPLIGRNVLGGTVHRVLAHAPSDVAVFVDKGSRAVQRILVPFLGGSNDRLALELARRIARRDPVEITVLRVVARGSQPDARDPAAGEAGLDEDGASVKVAVVEDDAPIEAVLRAARDADLVVIGISDEWGLDSHLFGFRRERLLRESSTSLLVVRRCDAPPPRTSPATVARPAST